LGGKNNIKEKKRILVIFIVTLLCFSFITHVLSANVVAQRKGDPGEPEGLLQRFGKFLVNFAQIIRFAAESAAADPPFFEISYNETVNLEIGMLNLDTGEFETKYWGLYEERFLNFEVIEYPGGNEHGKWFVTFDPPTVRVQEGVVLKTNASISLRSPRLAEESIQNGILKIRIHDTWVFGDIYRPREGGYFDEFGKRALWFYLAITQGWGKELSGHALTDPYDVDILVKVKPFHSVAFDSVPYIAVRPDEIVSIPITLQNNDTFSFRVVSDHDDIRIAEPMSITLAPGEVNNAYLGVSIPPSVFDFGTIHNIELEAYSIDEVNTTIASRTITLESKGVYFSEVSSLGIFFFIFIFIILVIFVMMRRRRLLDNICVKPDKPWDIPEEQKYLENLKKEDKQKYNEVLKMMEDEYKSALLWYDSYIKSALQPKPVKKEKVKKVKKEKPKKKIKPFFKKTEKPIEEKTVKEKSVKKEKPIKKVKYFFKKADKPIEETSIKEKPVEMKEKEDIKIIEEPIINKKEYIDKKTLAEKLKKERSLKKIKHDQEKQKRKLSKLNL